MNNQNKHKDELGFHQELKKTFTEGQSLEECSEEISKIESTFLSNVRNLKGYSWNEENFVASVEISESKKLHIKIIPSGLNCNFKIGLATFTISDNFSFRENKNEIINDFIWVSRLLRNEKEFNLVEQILNKRRTETINSNLNDNFISLFPVVDDEGKEIDEKFSKTFVAYFEKNSNISRYSIYYFFP